MSSSLPPIQSADVRNSFVRKYDEEVIDQVRQWYCDNGYPRDIEYMQVDGQKKAYHVIFREAEVA
ncbi:hypothetical protein [Diplocloster modestus]|uniref:Uncharacterized protein n=1 Tax=Diplocloster modestus TaxID=2850322 RepID=A0ABS6K9D8_9FIRM|nr:hypothetical protein [Diplocloster modestus]MBU9727129.1 hypothetical protein [Diplocloster modestus]